MNMIEVIFSIMLICGNNPLSCSIKENKVDNTIKVSICGMKVDNNAVIDYGIINIQDKEEYTTLSISFDCIKA